MNHVIRYRSQSLHSFFCWLSDSMDKIQIHMIFLFQFKLGWKAAETACDINDAFGPGTTNERVAQRWFKKFCNGDESLEDEDGRGRPTVVDNKHLKALIEFDPRKTTREVAVEIEVDHSTVVCHLKQIGKSKKLDKWVPHELNDNKKKIVVLRCLLRSFCATKTTHFSSGLWCVMRSGSSMTTGDIQCSGWILEKLHNTSRSRNCTKKRLWWLFGGLRSHPSQFLESGRNDYSGEVLLTNWRNATEAPTYVPEIGQYEGTNSPPWQCSPACCSTDPPEAAWIGLRDCLIHHIHQTSRPPIITFSSISTTSCSKNASKAEMIPNRPSMTSSLPELWISMLMG